MKIFKYVLRQINTTFSAAIFGSAIYRTTIEDYKITTIMLYIVVSLILIGYFVEILSNKE